jgi:protein-S-isoprenylcysteine O-methyltransferase Ste14
MALAGLGSIENPVPVVRKREIRTAKRKSSNISRGDFISVMKVTLLVANFWAAVVFFGKKAKEGKSWVYITGTIIYFGDVLLCAWLEDWVSVAFHAWGLFSIWGGFSALKALKTLDSQGTPETLELQG